MRFIKILKPFISQFNTAKVKFVDISTLPDYQINTIDRFLSKAIGSKDYSYRAIKRDHTIAGRNVVGIAAIDMHYGEVLGAIVFSMFQFGKGKKLYCDIHSLATNPVMNYIRTGIGSLLLLTAISIAKENKAVSVTLASSTQGHSFYSKFGMLRSDEIEYLYELPLDNIKLYNDLENKIFFKYQYQRIGSLFRNVPIRILSEDKDTGLFVGYLGDKQLNIINLPKELQMLGATVSLNLYMHYNFSSPDISGQEVLYAIYFTGEDVAAYKIQTAYLAYKSSPQYLKAFEHYS